MLCVESGRAIPCRDVVGSSWCATNVRSYHCYEPRIAARDCCETCRRFRIKGLPGIASSLSTVLLSLLPVLSSLSPIHTILFHGQQRYFATEPFLWPATSYGTTYRQLVFVQAQAQNSSFLPSGWSMIRNILVVMALNAKNQTVNISVKTVGRYNNRHLTNDAEIWLWCMSWLVFRPGRPSTIRPSPRVRTATYLLTYLPVLSSSSSSSSHVLSALLPVLSPLSRGVYHPNAHGAIPPFSRLTPPFPATLPRKQFLDIVYAILCNFMRVFSEFWKLSVRDNVNDPKTKNRL